MTLAAALRSANPAVGSCRCTRAWARLPRKPTCFTESSTGAGAHSWTALVLLLLLLSSLASPVGEPVPVPMHVTADGAEPVRVAGDASEPEAVAGDASSSEAGLLRGAEVVAEARFDREAGAVSIGAAATAGCDEDKWA